MKRLLILALFSLFLSTNCVAEHLCRATVSYSWQREKDVTKIMVFTLGLEVKGADEAAAKVLLAEHAERPKAEAVERCVKEHENQTGCVAAKIGSLSSTLQAISFSARKLLEESIASDCKLQQGKCGEAVLSEPQCTELIVASKEDAKDAGKEGGKDKEKKKK